MNARVPTSSPTPSTPGLLVWWYERVLWDVTAALGVTPEDVQAKWVSNQPRRIRQARAVLCWLLRELTQATWHQIANLLGCHFSQTQRNHRLVQLEIDAKHGFYLFALQLTLMHSRTSGALLGKNDASVV